MSCSFLPSSQQIQLGTVYRGRMRLSDEEVKQIYGRAKIPQEYVDVGLKKGVRDMVDSWL